MASTTEVALPTGEELSTALTAVMDLREFQIVPLAERIFGRLHTDDAPAPTLEEIGRLAVFVSDALDSLDEAGEDLRKVARCYSDLASLAHGDSVNDISPLYTEYGNPVGRHV
jgi:hypothetical protein